LEQPVRLAIAASASRLSEKRALDMRQS
jgi:hypothetical protein